MSGLVVDVFGDSAVIASSAAWVEKYKPEIKACISSLDGINYLSWRPSVEFLKEEGMDLSNLEEVYSLTTSARVKVKYLLEQICFVFRYH